MTRRTRCQRSPVLPTTTIASLITVKWRHNIRWNNLLIAILCISALGVTYRGCAKEFNLPEDCLSCKFCSGDDCNTEPIEDYGECYVCDDSNDENKSCAYMINVDKVSCGPSEKKGCFRSEIGNMESSPLIDRFLTHSFRPLDGVVVRGCASQLQPEGIAECEKGDVCKFCEGDGCNKKTDFQSCYSCDTTTDAYCSITQLVGSPKKVCADYMDTCVAFKEGEHTYRGCAKELAVPVECPGCKYCEWKDCNYEATEYFGQCRYCDGTPECAAGTDPTYISCPKGDHPQDTCFRSEMGKWRIGVRLAQPEEFNEYLSIPQTVPWSVGVPTNCSLVRSTCARRAGSANSASDRSATPRRTFRPV